MQSDGQFCAHRVQPTHNSALIFTLCRPSTVASSHPSAGQPRFMQDWQAVQDSSATAKAGPLIRTGSSTQGRSEITTDTPLNAVASRKVWCMLPTSYESTFRTQVTPQARTIASKSTRLLPSPRSVRPVPAWSWPPVIAVMWLSRMITVMLALL